MCDQIHDGKIFSCLNYTCDYRDRPIELNENFLDDITLALLIGCGTNVGDGNVNDDTDALTTALLNYGVDCVVGTRAHVMWIFMQLYVPYFRELINIDNGLTIEQAAEDAYDMAIDKLLAFTGWSENQFTSQAGRKYEFGNTIIVRNNDRNANGYNAAGSSLYPPRYGVRSTGY